MRLAPIETEFIDLFVQLAKLLGLPKSAFEIYGLLFVSPQPLAMDQIIQKLSLSKGGASQGLKLLRSLGAIRRVYVSGKRTDHFEAELELRKLFSGLIRDRLEPHLLHGAERLNRIERLTEELTSNEQSYIAPRVEKLRSWQRSGQDLLPLAQTFLA